jgi:acyl-CoA thioesterase
LFSTASTVRRIGPATFAGAIAPGWDVLGNAHGGYLMALAARACAEAAGRPDPMTITGHFLSPGRPGEVTIVVRVLRSGRRFATASAIVESDGRALLATLGSFAEIEGYGGPERIEAAPPDLPPPEECVRMEPTDTFPPPFMAQVDLRIHPEDARFEPSPGPPRFRGWIRFPNGEPIDTLGLLVAVDAFPPTAFRSGLPIAWTPTLELTAHVRARPAPGWLRCTFGTRFITGGHMEEDGEVWDETGRLVAQSRQLALLPRRPPPAGGAVASP